MYWQIVTANPLPKDLESNQPELSSNRALCCLIMLPLMMRMYTSLIKSMWGMWTSYAALDTRLIQLGPTYMYRHNFITGVWWWCMNLCGYQHGVTVPHRASPGPHRASQGLTGPAPQPNIYERHVAQRRPGNTGAIYRRPWPRSRFCIAEKTCLRLRRRPIVEATSCISRVSQFPTGNNTGCGEMFTQNPGIRCTSLRPHKHTTPTQCRFDIGPGS